MAKSSIRFRVYSTISKSRTLDTTPIGLNMEYTIRNNINHDIHVVSLDGVDIDKVAWCQETDVVGMSLRGVDIWYRKVNGNRNPKKPLARDGEQDVWVTNISYEEIKEGPVLIRELNLYICLNEQRSRIPSFHDTMANMLTNRIKLGANQVAYPFVLYANIPQIDNSFYLSIDGSEIVQVPIIYNEFLNEGVLILSRDVVIGTDLIQPRGIETTFDELTNDPDDVFYIDKKIIGSFNIASIKEFMRKLELKEIDPDDKRWTVAESNYIEDRVKKAVMITTADKDRDILALKDEQKVVNHEKHLLQDNLNRSEGERKRLEGLVKSLENQLTDENKSARKREEDKLRRQRGHTEYFKNFALFITTFVSTFAVLKAPVIAGSKWLWAIIAGLFRTVPTALV